MSAIVYGATMPKDLLAVLTKYGMPEKCTSFKIECAGGKEPVLLTFTGHLRVPKQDQTFEKVTETRVYKLLLVE